MLRFAEGEMGAIADFRPQQVANSYALSEAELEALAFILPLSPDYPDIENWYRTKVVPGLRCGTRKIVRIERDGAIAALGIGKADVGELKICTVRVAPHYLGKGMGLRVFDSLMSWLGTDHPHATVSSGKMPQFERIFDRFGFRLTSCHRGLYISSATEYFFNELETALDTQHLKHL